MLKEANVEHWKFESNMTEMTGAFSQTFAEKVRMVLQNGNDINICI